MKAPQMGMVVVSKGENDGPPFYIQHIVENSMAAKSQLEVGDELFSVDNLCCSNVADRPLLVATLTKLRQLLDRLANKQRPVEIKVFRSQERYSTGGMHAVSPLSMKVNPHASGRQRYTTEQPPCGSQEVTTMELPMPFFNPSSINGNGNPTGSECINENVDSTRKRENFPSYEVEPVRSGAQPLNTAPEMSLNCIKTAAKGITCKDIESSHSLFTETVKPIKTLENGALLHDESTSQPRHSPVATPIACLKAQQLKSPFDSPNPPSFPLPITSPSEMHFSIRGISPPPPSPIQEISRASSLSVDNSNSMELPPPPTPPPRLESPTCPKAESIKSTLKIPPQQFQYMEQNSFGGLSHEPLRKVANVLTNTVNTSRITYVRKDPLEQYNDKDNVVKNDHVASSTEPILPSIECSKAIESHLTSESLFIQPQAPIERVECPEDTICNSDVNYSELCALNGPRLLSHSKEKMEVIKPLTVMEDGVFHSSPLVESDVDEAPSSLKETPPQAIAIKIAPTLSNYVNEEVADKVPSQAWLNDEMPVPYETNGSLNTSAASAKVEVLVAETVISETFHSLGELVEVKDGKASSPPRKPPRGHERTLGETNGARLDSLTAESELLRGYNLPLPTKRAPGEPPKDQRNLPPPRPPRINVIGTWYTCAGCNQQLGTSDLMIVEQLSLFYHLSCFVCAECGIQLSDGQNETAVRIRNSLIYCYICYHRLSKATTHNKEGSGTKKSKKRQNRNENPSTAAIGQLVSTTPSHQADLIGNPTGR
uniref:PDZ domain-containing protein n=2 Tax=Mesocestoides corti TaxID=53468 RepID=A0A5K3EX86_MESCO